MFGSDLVVKELHIRELGLAIEDVDNMEGGVHRCRRAPVEPTNCRLPLYHRVHRRFENLHGQTNELSESFVFQHIRILVIYTLFTIYNSL
jgi:hypothetical protein